MNSGTLDQLLLKLCSSDNELRKSGESELEVFISNQPADLLVALSNIAVVHPNVILRSFSSILLRKLAMKQVGENVTLIEKLGESVLVEIQQKLLHSLQAEQENSVRTQVINAVSSIANFLLLKKIEWPQLFQVCGEFVSSPQPTFRRTSFLIFSGCPSFLSKQDQNHVKNIFVIGLQDQDYEVKLAALKACVSYLCLAKKAIRDGLTDLLPLMLNVIPPVLASGDKELDAIEGLGDIIELAAVHPKMFKLILPQTVEYMISQMKNVDLEDSTRQTCLELLITLCEGAPGIMRNHEPFARCVIPVVLEWMSQLDDDPSWYLGETIEDDDESSNETAGEQAMDRLAIYLGGSIVLPVTFNLIPTLLASPEWQKRHSALRCISAIGEGCLKIMESELDKVVHLVIPHLRDPHPRVRHAACNSIGQMCTDFAPKIQRRFHEPILTHLVPILDDLEHIRVANYGAAALVNFSESASKESITPYIDTIINKLLVLMHTGKTFVQEQAITTLATVAESAGTDFGNYYAKIMPVVLEILGLPNEKEVRNLKGKALECSSLIIMSVGKDMFAPDAIPFIEVLKRIQESVVDDDDPQASYLLSAWARVCKVMGSDFAPYLEIVLPPLLKSAEMQPELVAFEHDDDQYKEEDGWEVMALGEKNVAIKTSILEDKCTAVEMILCYAQEMGELFHPYVEHLIKVVTPMLKFYLNDGVKYAAAAVLPVLFKCWVKAQYPQARIAESWKYVMDNILEAIKDEDDTGSIAVLYTAIGDGVKIIGPSALNAEQMSALTQDLNAQLEQYLLRNLGRQKLREADDYDPADEDALQDEEYGDDQFLADISSVFTNFFQVLGVNFLPYFDQLLAKLNEFLTNPESTSRQWALGVFCDLIEFTGPTSEKYKDYFLQQIASSLSDSSPQVRQPACYGVGVAAKFGGQAYASFCVASIDHLFAIINSNDSRSEENVMATENAISAIAKIIRAYKDSGLFPVDTVVSHWINSLPIIEDAEEANDVYSLFVELIEINHPGVSNIALLPHLISISSKALSMPDLFDGKDVLKDKLTNCLRSLLTNCDQNGKQKLAHVLDDSQKQYLISAGLA